MMDTNQVLHDIRIKLEKMYQNRVQAEQYARWTLETITGKRYTDLLIEPLVITADIQKKIDHWLVQLIEHEEPIQYLIGFVPFGQLQILVEHPVLIPRPATEEWAVRLFTEIQEKLGSDLKLRILDLCTGSGCIALLAASLFPYSEIIGIDNQEHAIILAEKNKADLNFSNVSFINADIKAYVSNETFDLIVANPPYIAHDDWLHLSPSVTAWEDYSALVADENGYGMIQEVIESARYLLRYNHELDDAEIPQLAIEIGSGQSDALNLFNNLNKFHSVSIINDYAGLHRLMVSRISKKQ